MNDDRLVWVSTNELHHRSALQVPNRSTPCVANRHLSVQIDDFVAQEDADLGLKYRGGEQIRLLLRSSDASRVCRKQLTNVVDARCAISASEDGGVQLAGSSWWGPPWCWWCLVRSSGTSVDGWRESGIGHA